MILYVEIESFHGKPRTWFSRIVIFNDVFKIMSSNVFWKQFGFTFYYVLPIPERKAYVS